MPPTTSLPRRFILATTVASLLGAVFTHPPEARGADIFKDNNATNLTVGGSWVGGIVPTNLDRAIWDATVTAANTVVLGADLSVAGIAITNPGGAVTVNTGNILTIGALGIDLSVATQNLTLNPSIVAGATQTWTIGADRILSTAGTITLGTSVLTIAGSGAFYSTGIISGTTASGPALNFTGGSSFLSGANTFTGQTTIGSGALVVAKNAAALGAGGVGNETTVQAGGTFNTGGLLFGTERLTISGTGTSGQGALINEAAGNATNANNLTKVILGANATISAGGAIPAAYDSRGVILTSGGGRLDIRNTAAQAAGSASLDLAGFTLTKKGGNLLAVVNQDVSNGNIIVDEGQMSFEAGTLVQGTGTITVNRNGKLMFWGLSAVGNITRPIVVNGGALGDFASSASQSVASPISLVGANSPNFVGIANTTTFSGVISKDAGATFAELAKRGGGTVAFSNQANTFDAPLAIYGGNLQGNFTTAISGGTIAAPTALTGTPLGTNSTLNLLGGTLNIRVDGSNNSTNEYFSLGKSISLDRAPGGINLDRIGTNASSTDKNLVVTNLTFQPSSAANDRSIGQNQLTMTQGNGYRLIFNGGTMNNDTVLSAGDFTFAGNTTSTNKNSLVHINGNSWGFVGGTHDFNALFNVGSAQLRIGSMYGTATSSTTATAGSGTIFNGPNNSASFRAPTNIAAGQLIDLLSHRTSLATVNLESGFTSIPANVRASGSGGLGVSGATAFGNIDLSKIGDGTFRVGAGYAGAGNGTVTGTIAAGAGNVIRLAGVGTNVLTISGANTLASTASVEVGSDLINGGFRQSQANAMNGVVLFNGSQNYAGETTVNRSATLRFQSNTPGAGAVNLFGTMTAEGAAGTFIDGAVNHAVNIYGGAAVRFDSSALTTATDVNRWEDTTPIALINSTVQLDARNNLSTTNETVGAISYAGGSFLSLQRSNAGAAQIVQLQTPSLTRVGTGTLEITRAGSSAFGDTVKILATTTAPTVTNGMIAPSIMLNDPTRYQNFASYDATNGIVNAAFTGVIKTGATPGIFDTGLLATGIYHVDFAAANTTLTLGDDPTLYALKVGGGTGTTTLAVSGANDTITLRSGGLIFSADNSVPTPFSTDGTRTVNFNPNVVANNGSANIEAFINTRNAFTANVNGTVTANGLTKFGAGTLNLFANNATTLTGTVSVNQGILQVFGPTATSTFSALGDGLVQLAGGQLNIRSNNSAVTGAINPTMPNGISVPQNIPIATVDVNRSGADTASTGTIIFNPTNPNSTGLQLLGSPGVQGQTITFSGGTFGVQFGDNALNSFAGNVTVNNAITVTLNNLPTISGTAPVFTKSGGGSLILGVNNSTAATTAPAGTQVVVNAGTLDLRALAAVGTGATTSLVLNAGTLNLRRDTAGVYGGATAYPVIVNGNSAISVDRIGAGSLFQLGLGKLTLNNSATLQLNNGNTFGVDFEGAQINGNGFINVNFGNGSSLEQSARFLSGSNVGGGSIIKAGGGHLHLVNANNTFDGGLYVQQGYVRLRANGSAGTGTVTVNPGGTLDLNSNTNLNAGQKLVLHSNSSNLAMVSVNVGGVTHPTGANVEFGTNETGIIGLSNGNTLYNNAIDLGALYGGRWSLGGVPQGVYDPRYMGATLGVGADNVYRLGGGGTSFFLGITNTGGTPQNNVLTGTASVRLGFDSGNILGANGTNFQFIMGGTNNYTGKTVIHRGMVSRGASAANASGESVYGTGAVDVFGTMQLSGASTLQNGGVATNALTLHPGSDLLLDNNSSPIGGVATTNSANRIADGQALRLSGALVELVGNNNNATTETLGDVTYSGAARLRVIRNGTGSATLTLGSFVANGTKGNQVLLQSSAAGTLGGVDKILVTTGAPSPNNGMLGAQYVNITDNTFVTYSGANGFANITGYDKTLNATYTPGSILPNDKVDVGTAALTLTDNPTMYALRTSQTINIAPGAVQMTIRSGGLINTGTITIAPNLAFKDGAQNVEAKIYTTANLTLNGTLTADGVVKSGNGQLIVNMPQPNLTGGWVINSGDIIFNDPNAAGQSVASNTITINATQTSGGNAAQGLNRSRVVFQRDNATAETVTFTGGPIKVVNEGDIAALANNDRFLQIPNVAVESTGTASSAALSLDVRSNRFRVNIPVLTLNSDTTARVYDSTNTTNTGFWTNAAVGSLVGNNVRLNKIGNRTLELTGDNSGTFIGGSINVAAGTVRVTNAGSLGSASTNTNVERNAALEIGVANFSPAGTLTQQPGSIERWNQEDARGTGNYIVPAGVNLQLNTNVIGATARTITLQGGSLEGFLYTDHVAQADQRVVGSAVTISLGADSLVGQNILNGLGYEAGRAPTVAQPFADTYTGAYLRIEGKITGAKNLTKTGLDTVTIAPAAGITNDYNHTTVEMGVLRIGADNALPTGKTITTRTGGVFDLYGFNQAVGGLGTKDGGPNPGGTGLDVAGKVTNSGVIDNTLTVNSTDDFTYNGTIERNVALRKLGSGTLTLNAVSNYSGPTAIDAGVLSVNGSISGSAVAVNSGGTLEGIGSVGALTLNAGGTVAPGASPGVLGAGNTVFNGGTFALELNGLTPGTGYDQLNVVGTVNFAANTPLTLSLGFNPLDDGSQSFTIVNNDAAEAVSLLGGLFSFGGTPLSEGSVFDTGAQLFQITYAGGSGNDVLLTAVPEPSITASVLAGLAAMAGLRRRRRDV